MRANVIALCLLSACGGTAATQTSESLTQLETTAQSETTASVSSTSVTSLETTTSTTPTPTTWQPLGPGSRILIIGDSISIGYTEPLQEKLGDMVVYHHPDNAQSTANAISANRLDTWLGSEPWDVIYFNFGLHDLAWTSEAGQEVVAGTEGGGVKVPLTEYEQNLEQIVARLKATDARLIWATTTPVYETSGSRVAGTEADYNRVATAVMERNGIQISDLHAFSVANLDKYRVGGSDNVHFLPQGYALLSDAVAEALLSTPPG